MEKVDKKIENYFEILNTIDVSKKVEKKNGLNYLSWAWAWAELKKIHPKANYKIYEQENGCIYWTDGKTCWVKTGVIIDDIEHIEYLPVMDYRNKSISLEDITSFNVNSTIQRSLTKAVARHGLGLYIYAGEDLPEEKGDARETMPMQEGQRQRIITAITNDLVKEEGILKQYSIKKLEELNSKQADEIILVIEKRSKKGE